MLTQKTFKETLTNLHNNRDAGNYLLAVSGGADSMVLLHLFSQSGLHFEVAHVNYKLRGKDSEADRETVENYCLENNIDFHLYEVSAKDQQPENSIQNWARNLRYAFFRKVQKERELQFLVTAHHLNDQLETFLINLSKASGIKGLSGMPANENQVLRPLLQFSKDDIYDFAEEHQIKFREDLSNRKNDYLRNFIRNEIAPKLFRTNDHFLENFAKSLTYLNQVKDFADEKIKEIERKIISEKEGFIQIQKATFAQQSDFVKFEILKKLGFDDVEEFPKILRAEKGKVFHAQDFKLTVDREYFVLTGKTSEKSEFPNSDEEIIVAESLDTIKDHTFSLSQFISPESNAPSDLKWIFDGEKLQFPLKLRKRKTGDLFFPIGMIGKKTISKFFKDEKIPILAQQKIWLLCDGIDNVLGIIPFRQDRRFAAEVNSKSKITITF